MNYPRNEEQQALYERFAGFAREHLNTGVSARYRDGVLDRELWKLCAAQGVQGLCIPDAYGGAGLSAENTIAALEGFGYGCEDGGLAFALGAQLLSCSVPIWLHGSEAQRHDVLPGLCRGELVATNAITEAQGGSDAFNMMSAATLDDGYYSLAGCKSYCANAPIADLCLAYISTDQRKGFAGGVSVFLLRRDRHAFAVLPGIEKLGLKTCPTGKVVLDGVRAEPGDLLGRPGAGGMVFTHSMDWERTGLSALHVGVMTRLLEGAVAFARGRRSGAVAISKHQAVAHVLADISTQLEAARLMVYRAAAALDRERSATREAAQAKLFTSELFRDTSARLLQIHAAQGYTADSDIGRAMTDALASTLYSGTSEIQRNIIAGRLGC